MSEGRKASTEDRVDPRRQEAIERAQALEKEGRFLDAAKALASVDRSGGSPYAPLATSVLDR